MSWEETGKILGRMSCFGYGPQGYLPPSLFKALILQAWHSLSDPGLEEALRVRLDFMTFTGFDRDVPDETTVLPPYKWSRNNLVANSFWACPIYRTTGSEKIRFFTLLLKEKYCLGN